VHGYRLASVLSSDVLHPTDTSRLNLSVAFARHTYQIVPPILTSYILISLQLQTLTIRTEWSTFEALTSTIALQQQGHTLCYPVIPRSLKEGIDGKELEEGMDTVGRLLKT